MIDGIGNWKKREGLIKESVWLAEGIKMFRRLLNEYPGNVEYISSLAKLLIRSGTDEKLKYVNLMKAQQLFEEVLALYPDNAEALYRLGHICYENNDFERAIEYFMKAVKQSLSEVRLLRAYSAISKNYYYLGEDEKSKSYLEQAIALDLEKNFTSEINEVKSLITQDGKLRRLVRYTDGIHQFVDLEDAQGLMDDVESDAEAILDLSHFRPSFIGPNDVVSLERKQAEIVSHLIERDYKFVSMEELLMVWDEEEQPVINTIRAYISEIRKKLKACLPENQNNPITSKRGVGYRWVCSIPTKIIKQL